MPKKHKDLPQILMLQRVFIQKTPQGQQVALYHSDSLDHYIAIAIQEKSITKESIIEELQLISQTEISNSITFKDDSSLTINKECADFILTSDLELENIEESDKEFLTFLEKAVKLKQEVIPEQESE